MKLETKIVAAGLLAEIREYVAREIGSLKATTADASRVGELMMHVARLKERVRVLEAETCGKTSHAHRKAQGSLMYRPRVTSYPRANSDRWRAPALIAGNERP
jgi:hypothetical protein